MYYKRSKLLALLLSLATLLSLLVFPVTATEEVAEIAKNYVSENFESYTVTKEEGLDLNFSATANNTLAKALPVGNALQAYSANAFSATVKSEDGNNFFRLSASGKTGFMLLPKNFEASAYTVTGSLRWNGDVKSDINQSKYVGIYFSTTPTERTNRLMLLRYADATGLRTESTYHKNTENNLKLGNWNSFKLVVTESTLSFYCWPAGSTCPTTPIYTQAITGAVSTPRLELMCAAENSTIDLDNLTFRKDIGGVSTVGAQVSAVTNDRFAVRFVGIVDSLDYQSAGFSVTCTYTEDGKKETADFTLLAETVYSEITANEHGITAYTAEELGGCYLMALGIHDIPASLTEIKFDVTAFYYDENGQYKTANAVDCYTTVKGTSVLLTDEKPGTTVTPEQFGAKGDGLTDDTQALAQAVAYASQNDMTLLLTGDYRTLTTTDLNNINVRSDNARISYYGKEFNRPAVDMYENVNIYGKINIYADHYAPAGTHGNRCGMAFGNYDTGRGAKNCYVEHIVIWSGGMPGADAILLTGDSSDITFGTIEVPEGHNKVNVPIMMHWGNYGQHHPADLIDTNTPYVHEEGYTPTTHPHDIKIGLIDSHAQHTALCISACYNVTVDEVRQVGGKSAVRVIPGDVGFKYASAAEQAHGPKNIYVKKVTGTELADHGLYLAGIGGYEPGVAVQLQIKIDEATLSASADGNGMGVGFYGIADGVFGNISLNGFAKAAIHLGYSNQSVKVQSIAVTNCKHHTFTSTSDSDLIWSRYGKTEHRDPSRGIVIDKMTVEGGTCTSTFAVLHNVNGLHIKDLTVKNTKFSSLFQLYSTTKNLLVDQVTLTPHSSGHTGIFDAQNVIPAANNIKVTIKGANGIPDSYRNTCGATLIRN